MLRGFMSIILLLFALSLNAQVKVSDSFKQILDTFHVEFLSPVEGKYKALKPEKNDLFTADFRIRSRKEKIEILYYFEPDTANFQLFPQVSTTRMVLHLATNNQDALISSLDLPEKQLKEGFNADWGKVSIFRPKESFSYYEYCKLLTLYKVDRGIMYILFLFDEPSLQLDQRFQAIIFQD